MEFLLVPLPGPQKSPPAQALQDGGRMTLTPSEDQQSCQGQVGSTPSSCCRPESKVLLPSLSTQGLRAPQLHGTEVDRWPSNLLPVFLFLLWATLLGAFHMLVDGLRGSWGQPFLWGAWRA